MSAQQAHVSLHLTNVHQAPNARPVLTAQPAVIVQQVDAAQQVAYVLQAQIAQLALNVPLVTDARQAVIA